MSQPITSLSQRNVVRTPLQKGPSFPEVIRDFEVGGPEDPADRRLILDSKTLRHLLDIAEGTPTGRVVLHQIGLRVQVLQERDGGHRWENVTLIGTEAKPETSGLFTGQT